MCWREQTFGVGGVCRNTPIVRVLRENPGSGVSRADKGPPISGSVDFELKKVATHSTRARNCHSVTNPARAQCCARQRRTHNDCDYHREARIEAIPAARSEDVCKQGDERPDTCCAVHAHRRSHAAFHSRPRDSSTDHSASAVGEGSFLCGLSTHASQLQRRRLSGKLCCWMSGLNSARS